MKKRIMRITLCGVLAAAYTGITLLTTGLSFGPIQIRLAEALCLLPMLYPQAVWGVVLGCAVSNLFSPVSGLDVVVGTAATLFAALWTTHIRRTWLAPLPMTVCNAVLVGGMLAAVYTPENFWAGFWLMAAQVALGELVAGYGLGVPLVLALKRAASGNRLD